MQLGLKKSRTGKYPEDIPVEYWSKTINRQGNVPDLWIIMKQCNEKKWVNRLKMANNTEKVYET